MRRDIQHSTSLSLSFAALTFVVRDHGKIESGHGVNSLRHALADSVGNNPSLSCAIFGASDQFRCVTFSTPFGQFVEIFFFLTYLSFLFP